MSNHDNRFDLDLQYGQEGERWLAWLGTDQAKVEVKTERDQWATTGNAVFEFTSRGKPSGIAVTQADYWVHNFHLNGRSLMSYVWPVQDLKDFLRTCYRVKGYAGSRITNGGDDHTSELVIVPISSLYLIVTSSLPCNRLTKPSSTT
jgi:hypothetical protein